ncbi:MAG: hypothetical protein Q7R31_01050 [Candidatus Levybacteria bacterium]|nr:hypothetical protein [Candidatus Levybacteria bacterium]
MTVQEEIKKTQEYLPKENLDLPKEPLDLPQPPISSPNPQQYSSVKTLLAWTAPGRPFRKKGRQFYLTSLLIMLLIEIILFLFSQYLLMLVVVSLVFVSFALATVPPRDFNYRISSEGITIEDHFFLWQELYDFYFKKREGVEVLHVRTHSMLPGELIITLGTVDKEHVKSVLLPYLPYREIIRSSFMEKSGEWLARNFPLDSNTPSTK